MKGAAEYTGKRWRPHITKQMLVPRSCSTSFSPLISFTFRGWEVEKGACGNLSESFSLQKATPYCTMLAIFSSFCTIPLYHGRCKDGGKSTSLSACCEKWITDNLTQAHTAPSATFQRMSAPVDREENPHRRFQQFAKVSGEIRLIIQSFLSLKSNTFAFLIFLFSRDSMGWGGHGGGSLGISLSFLTVFFFLEHLLPHLLPILSG